MKIAIFPLALPAFLGCWVAQAADIPTESKRANEFFDKCCDETVARHPVDESFYGIKTHYDQLEGFSDEKAAADLKALQDQSRHFTPRVQAGITRCLDTAELQTFRAR